MSLSADKGILVPLVMVLTFVVYGAIHLLAWQYHFPTRAESILWRTASVATASSGLIVLAFNVTSDGEDDYMHVIFILLIAMVLCSMSAIARAFLFFESFRVLPNSPASVYEVPRWTAYIPHI